MPGKMWVSRRRQFEFRATGRSVGLLVTQSDTVAVVAVGACAVVSKSGRARESKGRGGETFTHTLFARLASQDGGLLINWSPDLEPGGRNNSVFFATVPVPMLSVDGSSQYRAEIVKDSKITYCLPGFLCRRVSSERRWSRLREAGDPPRRRSKLESGEQPFEGRSATMILKVWARRFFLG